MIPPTFTTDTCGITRSLGAVDIRLEDYVLWVLDDKLAPRLGLNEMPFNLSDSTAYVLDIAANQLIQNNQAIMVHNDPIFPGGWFTTLSRRDRLKAVMILEGLKVNVENLPFPYTNNPGFLLNMMDGLNRLILFGFYSEWIGYGEARFHPTTYQLAFLPPSWLQVGYPGPSFGYRDFRGYLLKMDHQGGVSYA